MCSVSIRVVSSIPRHADPPLIPRVARTNFIQREPCKLGVGCVSDAPTRSNRWILLRNVVFLKITRKLPLRGMHAP